jgi:hypothetical protein
MGTCSPHPQLKAQSPACWQERPPWAAGDLPCGGGAPTPLARRARRHISSVTGQCIHGWGWG